MKRAFSARRNRGDKRRGQALVETAFVVVILLGLSLGLIQWGVLYNASIALTNLSREGARFAAVHPDANGPIIQYVKDNAPPGIRAQDLTITISPAEGSAMRKEGEAIRVTLDYDMSRKLFLPSKMFAEPYTIVFFNKTYRAQGSMMIEK